MVCLWRIIFHILDILAFIYTTLYLTDIWTAIPNFAIKRLKMKFLTLTRSPLLEENNSAIKKLPFKTEVLSPTFYPLFFTSSRENQLSSFFYIFTKYSLRWCWTKFVWKCFVFDTGVTAYCSVVSLAERIFWFSYLNPFERNDGLHMPIVTT